MTAPRRRPLQRDDLGVERVFKHGAAAAPEIELGITQLREELRDLGWPARTPDGDRHHTRRITIRCRTCNETVDGSGGKDAHIATTDHRWFTYDAPDATIDPSCIDYADPTGNLSMRLDRLADDYEQFEDHRHAIDASLRAMAGIARRYMPKTTGDSEPACSVLSCDGAVERTASGGYRGMERISGCWVAKQGLEPVCARHRSIERRAS